MTGVFFSGTFISLSDPWFHFIRTPLSSGQSALGQSVPDPPKSAAGKKLETLLKYDS